MLGFQICSTNSRSPENYLLYRNLTFTNLFDMFIFSICEVVKYMNTLCYLAKILVVLTVACVVSAVRQMVALFG